jgi:hypothetical protein
MRAWLVASAVLVLAFAPAPLPKRAKGKDHESQLIGAWRIRTIKWQGRDSYHAAVFGDRATITKSDRVVVSRGRITFQVNGSTTEAHAFTFQLSGGGEIRQIDFGETGRRVLGLYQFRGGVLHLSYGIDGTRPKSLTGDGNEIALILDRR